MSNQKKFHGLDDKHLLNRRDVLRDTRPLSVQLIAGMGNQMFYTAFMVLFMAIPIVFPAATLFCLFCSSLYTICRYLAFKRETLPLRLPSTYKGKDYGDRLPGGKGFHKASGVFFVGNDATSNEELWLAFRDVLTHHLMYGSTGAGKTENLVSLSFNSLAMGGGLSYIDPKAFIKLAFQLYALARFVGRDHDWRFLNYGVSSKPAEEFSPKKTSNTNNPFSYGSAESLTQFIAATIKTSNDGNAIFGQNAQVLVTAAMFAAVEKRNSGDWELDVTKIRELLTLPAMAKVVEDPSLTSTARNAIKQFLVSVGWQEGVRLDRQGKNLAEQFAYARSYFGLFLASLSDTYGHIYKTKYGEIDFQDVLKNRRILCVYIPSVEKTIQETENVGQLNLSGLKNALVACLGDKVMGTVEDVMGSLPIDLENPFLSVTDEYAAIQTPGYELFLTQGRGFGCSALIGTQDRAGLYKKDEAGAQQIEANSKVKSLGALDDPKQTFELAKEMAGETFVMQTQGSHIDKSKSMSMSFEDQQQTQVVAASRVDIRDFQEQVEGEFHLFFRGKIVRARAFFADPPLPKHQQLIVNDMLAVAEPDKQEIALKLQRTQQGAKLLGQMVTSRQNESTPDMTIATKRVKDVFDQPKSLPKNDVAICAFMAWTKGEDSIIDAFTGTVKANQEIRDQPQVQIPQPPEEQSVEEPQEESHNLDGLPDFLKEKILSTDAVDTDEPEESEATEQPEVKKPEKEPTLPETPEPQEQIAEVPDPEEPAQKKDIYQGFRTIMDRSETLFNDRAETVQEFKSDWTKMEQLCGASRAEAVQRSEETARHLQDASQDTYPDAPPPEKPDDESTQQMKDFMDSLLNEFSPSS